MQPRPVIAAPGQVKAVRGAIKLAHEPLHHDYIILWQNVPFGWLLHIFSGMISIKKRARCQSAKKKILGDSPVRNRRQHCAIRLRIGFQIGCHVALRIGRC